ncbi:hypothetical protein [Thiolapillus sp.]|uniref:hypothetical protein n=1 Tax=Thiolapillus sp. TaxID=2017437 RepID=UPI003AF67AE2
MTRTAGAPMGCQRPSRFWGLGCPKIYHEAEDTLEDVVMSDRLSLSRLIRPMLQPETELSPQLN